MCNYLEQYFAFSAHEPLPLVWRELLAVVGKISQNSWIDFLIDFLVICIYQGEVSLQPITLFGRTFSFTFSSYNSVLAIRPKCFVIETLSFSPLWGPYMFPYLRTNWLISLHKFQNFLPCIHQIKGKRLLRKKNKYVWEGAIDHP